MKALVPVVWILAGLAAAVASGARADDGPGGGRPGMDDAAPGEVRGADVAEPPSLEELVRQQHLDKPAPELTGVVGLGGAAGPRLAALAGKVVLLEFYAGWCPNCRALSPVLARWHERYRARGLAVVGVTNDDPETAARVVRDWRIPYAVGCAETDLPYAAVALPTMFLVDRKGVVREVSIGRSAAQVAALEKRLQQLLRQKG